MLIFIPLLPFIGFVINAFLGKRLPKSISGGLACAAIVGSFAVALAAVWSVVSSHHAMEQTAFTWITSGELSIPCAFRLDNLSSLMILNKRKLLAPHLEVTGIESELAVAKE